MRRIKFLVLIILTLGSRIEGAQAITITNNTPDKLGSFYLKCSDNTIQLLYPGTISNWGYASPQLTPHCSVGNLWFHAVNRGPVYIQVESVNISQGFTITTNNGNYVLTDGQGNNYTQDPTVYSLPFSTGSCSNSGDMCVCPPNQSVVSGQCAPTAAGCLATGEILSGNTCQSCPSDQTTTDGQTCVALTPQVAQDNIAVTGTAINSLTNDANAASTESDTTPDNTQAAPVQIAVTAATTVAQTATTQLQAVQTELTTAKTPKAIKKVNDKVSKIRKKIIEAHKNLKKALNKTKKKK